MPGGKGGVFFLFRAIFFRANIQSDVPTCLDPSSTFAFRTFFSSSCVCLSDSVYVSDTGKVGRVVSLQLICLFVGGWV